MKTKGHTLIEVLLGLTIFCLLSAGGFVWARAWFHSAHQSVHVNHLVAALQYARMEAIRLGETVVICGSSDLRRCNGDWRGGQIVVFKKKVLEVLPRLPADAHWEWKGSLGKNDQLAFSSLGFTEGQQGSFYYVVNDQPKARVVISHTGSIRKAIS